MLAYMAIKTDFDDNISYVLDKQRFTHCAFITRE